MRVAVFVDAGYLYAAGSIAVVGIKPPRAMIDLNQPEAIAKLRAAAEKSDGAQLLRIYWYDGELPRRRFPRTDPHRRRGRREVEAGNRNPFWTAEGRGLSDSHRPYGAGAKSSHLGRRSAVRG